jgi:hypothetical protein
MAGSASTTRHGALLLLAFTTIVLMAATPGGQAPTADTLTLRIIVVETQEDARLAHERAARGEDVAELARTLSVDPSAPNGGMLGTLKVSSLRPELQNALRNVGVGEISPIVRVPLGFAFLEVVSGAALSTTEPSVGLMGLTSEGNVKYVIDVAGFGTAAVAARLFSSPEEWNRNPQAACEQRTRAIDTAMATLRKDFASPSAGQLAAIGHDVVQGLTMLGQFHVYRGEMNEAIREYERAYGLAAQHDPKSVLDLEETLGIAYLHRAEMDNGIYHEPGDRCLLTHDGLPAFAKTTDVKKAIEHFSR